MPLTDQDLEKIKAVVDAGTASTKQYVDRRITESEARLSQRMDGLATKEQVEQVKTMLEGDTKGIVEDVETLKVRVTALESRHA